MFARTARMLAIALPVSLLMTAPAVAQMSASGQATVRVGQVSLLDVERRSLDAAVDGPREASQESGLRTEIFRVHVRANHRWRVVLAAESGGATAVWVRTVGVSGENAVQYVEPGAAIEVASGDGGDRVVEVEVRWEVSAHPSAASPPITYLLASSD